MPYFQKGVKRTLSDLPANVRRRKVNLVTGKDQWVARGYTGWRYDRRRVYLGHFDTYEEAVEVERIHREMRLAEKRERNSTLR